MEQLEGKVAVVTGAASGIGLALARRWAADGMKVVLGDVEAPALDAAVAELAAGGAEVASAVVDVSRAEDVERLADVAQEAFGAVHVVCNNAGVSGGGRSWEIPVEEWEWILAVNLYGVIHGIRTFVPRIVASGGGHVVNTASMAGMVTTPGMAPYTVSKFGVVALSETLAIELSATHPEVGVSVLCPGWVNTKIMDADRNRPGGPRDAGEVTEQEQLLRDAVRGMIASGLEPSHVADLVHGAVLANRFYVFTHDAWTPMIEARHRRIREGEAPQLSLPM